MSQEAHDGVVAFTPLSAGREQVKLGQLTVGEIGPVGDPRSQYAYYWGLTLPWAMSQYKLAPARDIEDARKQVVDRIGDWLQLANLRPNGSADE